MPYLSKAVLPLVCAFLFLPACSSNANRALYEGIKTQNEINKTPAERALTPSPSYDSYRKTRDSLTQTEPAIE